MQVFDLIESQTLNSYVTLTLSKLGGLFSMKDLTPSLKSDRFKLIAIQSFVSFMDYPSCMLLCL